MVDHTAQSPIFVAAPDLTPEAWAFTPEERGWVLNSVLASQAAAGVVVTREEAGRLLDSLDGVPMPKLLEED